MEWKNATGSVTYLCPKKKNPARLNLRGVGNRTGSTLAVLEAFARPGLAVFFAFAFAGIAGEQTLGLEGGAQIDVGLQKGTGDAVPDGAGLAVGAAALDVDADVKLAGGGRGGQRLGDDHPERVGGEISFERASVDGDLAGAGGDADAGNGGLAPAGAEKFSDGCHKYKVAITF